jgi:hypothetical protein
MSNMARAVPESAAPGSGIPLDLAPLLTPYGQNQRLLIRVVQLPRLARFSRGSGNDDGTWSLMPGDLDGLELLLPEDEDPPKTLSIRIVGIDRDENATIVAQLNVPLPPMEKTAKSSGDTAWQRRMERRVAAALRLGRRRAAEAVAEAEARWQAESETQQSDSQRALDDEWRQQLEAERSGRAEAEARAEEAAQRLAALTEELDAARARAAAAEAAGDEDDGQRRRSVEEAEGRLAQEFEHKLATARAAWQEEGEAHVAAAVKQAADQAEAEAESRLAAAQARWREEAGGEIEAARAQAAQAQSEIARLEAGLAEAEARGAEAAQRLATLEGDLEEATRQRVEAESEAGRLTTRLAEAETQQQAASAAQLAERTRQLEEAWQQKVEAESRARAAAESRADEAAERLSALSAELATAKAQAVAAAEQSFEQPRPADEEIEARLAQRVETQVAAARARWEKDNRARLDAAVQQAVGEAEAAAKRRLEAARRDWDKELQRALAVAEGKWRGEEAKRLAAARAEWQREFRSEVGKGRRGLRNLALRQRLARVGRLSLRAGLVAGALAAAYIYYPQLKPVIVDRWTPKVAALAGDAKTTALTELQALGLLPEGPTGGGRAPAGRCPDVGRGARRQSPHRPFHDHGGGVRLAARYRGHGPGTARRLGADRGRGRRREPRLAPQLAARRRRRTLGGSAAEQRVGAAQVALLGLDLLLHALGLGLQLRQVFLQLVDAQAVEVLGLGLLLARFQILHVHGEPPFSSCGGPDCRPPSSGTGVLPLPAALY